ETLGCFRQFHRYNVALACEVGRYPTRVSLFRTVARSTRRVSQAGTKRRVSEPARDSLPSSCAAPGRRRFRAFIAYPVKFGNSALPRIAPRAAKVRVSDGWPRRQAARIFRAARLAFIEISGMPFEVANHANSASCFPLKLAFTCEPMRIIPGVTLVT